jgi:hypothetical protein
MSKRQEDYVTLEIGGIEGDFEVRGDVDVEPTGSGWQAVIDGGVQALIRGKWTNLDEVDGLSARSRERVFEALETCALEDDSDACAAEEAGDMDREEVWA